MVSQSVFFTSLSWVLWYGICNKLFVSSISHMDFHISGGRKTVRQRVVNTVSVQQWKFFCSRVRSNCSCGRGGSGAHRPTLLSSFYCSHLVLLYDLDMNMKYIHLHMWCFWGRYKSNQAALVFWLFAVVLPFYAVKASMWIGLRFSLRAHFGSKEAFWRGGCSLAGRAGRLVIGRSLVQIPALGWAELLVEVSLSKILNPKLPLTPCMAASAISEGPCDELESREYPALTQGQLGLAPAKNPVTPWKG